VLCVGCKGLHQVFVQVLIRVLAVRSCDLIKPRPKKVFPDRYVWAFSHKGLSNIWGRSVFSGARLAFFYMF
jgi:hypothetical protein